MTVRLGGKEYETIGPIERFVVQSLPPEFRTSGTQARASFQDLPVHVFRALHKWGVGWSQHPVADNLSLGAMQDCNGDARWPGHFTLPHADQAVARPDPDDTNGNGSDTALHCLFNFAGELIGIFQDIGTPDPHQDIRSRLFQGLTDTWTLGVNIGYAGSEVDWVAAYDGCVHKGAAYVVFGHENGVAGATLEDGEYRVRTQASVGGAWSDVSAQPGASALYIDTTTGAGTDVPENNGYPHAVILDGPAGSRDDLIVGIQEEALASGGSVDQTRIYHTPDKGANWTNTGNVPGKPRGRGIWYDPFTGGFPSMPVISTTTNAYVIDAANSAAVPILPESLLGGSDDAGFMCVGPDGALYVSLASGNIVRVPPPTQLDRVAYEVIGPITTTAIRADGQRGDGIIASKRGPVTWMESSGQFVYVAFQGDSISHIMCFNPFERAWFPFHQRADTNKIYRMAFSASDDGTERLHIAIDAGSTTTLQQFEHPDESLATVTALKETSGHLALAEYDLNDPHTKGNFVEVLGRFADLSATDAEKYASLNYGIDGAGWTSVTNTGRFVSGDKRLQFGKTQQNVTGQTEAGTPIGINGTTIQLRVNLVSDDGTEDGPDLQELQLNAYNAYDRFEGWRFFIDVAATARKRGPRATPDSVAEEIHETFVHPADDERLITFDDDKRHTHYVRVRGTSLDMSIVKTSGIALGDVEGVYALEIIEGVQS